MLQLIIAMVLSLRSKRVSKTKYKTRSIALFKLDGLKSHKL